MTVPQLFLGDDYEERVSGVFEQIRQSALPESIKNDYNQNYLDFLMEFGSSVAKYNELESRLRPLPVYVVESRKRTAASETNEHPEKIHRTEEAIAHSGTPAGLVPAGASAAVVASDPQHWPYSQHPQASYGYASSVRTRVEGLIVEK